MNYNKAGKSFDCCGYCGVNGKVSRQPTVMNYGVSDLSDIMLDSGPYRHKHGSARDGTRFTYKKKK